MITGERKPLVCILEDDFAVRDSLRLMLERNGYEAETFTSANDFLLSRAIDRFDCLVLDFQLPGMTGLELLELLRLRAYSKPAIMIAGTSELRFESRMRRAGASELLRKPIAPDALLTALKAAIGGNSAQFGHYVRTDH